jgi:hypothetical protein
MDYRSILDEMIDLTRRLVRGLRLSYYQFECKQGFLLIAFGAGKD